MGDASSSDTEAGNHADKVINQTPNDLQPFNGAEFQVSHLLERLEASVNARDGENVGTPRREEKKVSKDSSAGRDQEPPTMEELLKDLEDLVFKCDALGEGFDPPLLPTDPVARSAIIAHSISVLLQRLERAHAVRLGTYIADEATQMIINFLRLPNYYAFYHTEQLEGLVRITRMLLHHAYPRYLEDGALAFSSRMPCIYSSVASPLGIVQHLCRQLGLPLACVRPVPVDPSGRGMDPKALDRLCEEDLASGRTPLLVLGEAGAQPLGCGSDLRALQACCASRKLYLHLRGHAVALSALYPCEQIFNVADSLTITPALWLGITGLPNVTLYRIPEPVVAIDISKVTNSSTSSLPALSGLTGGAARLTALPLWVAFRLASLQGLQRHVASAFRSVKIFHNIVASLGLRILSTKPVEDDCSKVELIDAISSSSACVCFQFAPTTSELRPPPYFDKLNSWLGQVLQREPDMVPIEVCETEPYGVVLRFCPLEGTLLNEAAVEMITCAVESQVRVLQATVTLRGPFQRRVNDTKGLELLSVPGWAGLGGVRYVPPGWEDAPEKELNALNKQLVDTLRATDNAFSCGEGEDGRTCVRFGMVTADTDIDELLDLVISAGREVEESSKALTTMSEVLKKSISAAEEELEKEKAAMGVLRLVPVVGRVVQWWAPAQPPRGRTLHLPTAAFSPTDRIIQIQHDKVQTDEHVQEATPRSSPSPQQPPQQPPQPSHQ